MKPWATLLGLVLVPPVVGLFIIGCGQSPSEPPLRVTETLTTERDCIPSDPGDWDDCHPTDGSEPASWCGVEHIQGPRTECWCGQEPAAPPRSPGGDPDYVATD